MAELNKISSFKSFTEIKNQEATMKLRETNNAKRQETVGKIGAILDEMGLTSLSELDEEKKQALINKMFGNVSEDEAEDIEDELNKLGKPKKLEEGNAFIYAAAKAKNAGKKTFQFNGKTYKVTLKTDTGLREDNVFEIEGETYKIEEAKRTKFTGKTAHDLYTQTGGKPVEVFVKNDWYSIDPKELKDDKGDYFTGYTQDGSDHEFYLKDIDFIQESVESIDEARSISKIQYDWSKLTTTMAATAQNWKAAEGPAKEALLAKLKEMTAQKKALEAELDAAIADKDKDIELVVTESKENEEASNILDDILGERDMEEVHGMSMEDALVTVKTYGHTGSKAKKIAEELWGMCNEAFNRLPKDVIGNELYLASQNLTNLYSSAAAGNDIDTGVIDSVVRQLNTVKKSVKKFNKPEEVVGTVYESQVNEAEKFKSTQDFEEFLEEIDGMPEVRIKRIMGKDYIDTPGGFRDEADDYDNDIVEYTLSNMGRKDFEALKAWWENNVQESVNEAATKQFDVDFNMMVKNIKSGYGWIDPEYVADTWENSSDSIDFELVKGEIYKRLIAAKLLAYADEEDEESAGQYVKSLKELGIKESVVNEAEVKSDEEFKEYAMTVLKKAFGDDFDEAKAGEAIDGILKKCGDDYGACVGMLTSSLGESVVTEREETQIGTHRYQGKSYPLYTDDEHNHYIKVNGRIIEVDESVVTEGFDANYWEDYHDSGESGKTKNPTGMQVQQEVQAAVEDWNDNNEVGPENEVTPAGEKKVLKLAKEFVKAKGYISFDIIDAMIAQES